MYSGCLSIFPSPPGATDAVNPHMSVGGSPAVLTSREGGCGFLPPTPEFVCTLHL